MYYHCIFCIMFTFDRKQVCIKATVKPYNIYNSFMQTKMHKSFQNFKYKNADFCNKSENGDQE